MIDRKKNYASQKSTREDASKLYSRVRDAFKDRKDRDSSIEDYWDIYNCNLNTNQSYNGESQIFVPIVRDAIDARVKRFTGMLFPNAGRTIECISETGDQPHATIALLERHIKFAKLRTILPAVFRNGDIEGNWTIMVDWKRTVRNSLRKSINNAEVEGVDYPDEFEDIEEVEVIEEGPEVIVISDKDIVVLPATCSNIQDAEIVTVAIRLTEDAIKEKVKDGWFVKSVADSLSKDEGNNWTAKRHASDAGVKVKGGMKFFLIYQSWTKMEIQGKTYPVVVHFGGPDLVLGIHINPNWSGKIPIISEPIDKVAGSFFGRSKIETVATLQYQINDMMNMGQDSAAYSVMPIVFTDPAKNPRVESMMLGMAAIWQTSPNDTQIVKFPELWKDALTIVQTLKSQVMESMDVNEGMLGKMPQGRKNAQAIASMQQEASSMTGDVVKRFEDGILNPMLEWFFELDTQYREKELTIINEGQIGIESRIEQIPVTSFHTRYQFRWLGTEAFVGVQRLQQMIALMNVLRGIPPQQMNGRQLDIGPIIDYVSQVTFGDLIAPRVIVDNSKKITIPTEEENQMLFNNIPIPVSPADNDIQHIQDHQDAAEQTGDPTGKIRLHIMAHVSQMQAKAQAAAPKPQGMPGIPGASGQPGVAGTPRPGATPMMPRGGQNPPGSIHQDNMADASAGMRG